MLNKTSNNPKDKIELKKVAYQTTRDSLQALFNDNDIASTAGYYRAAQEGVSGQVLKEAIDLFGDRDLFAQVIGKDKSNISRSYRVAKFDPLIGDAVLDTLRIYFQANKIYQSQQLASEWLHSKIPVLEGQKPIDIMTTPSGRELVRQTLKKIEFGDYA